MISVRFRRFVTGDRGTGERQDRKVKGHWKRRGKSSEGTRPRSMLGASVVYKRKNDGSMTDWAACKRLIAVDEGHGQGRGKGTRTAHMGAEVMATESGSGSQNRPADG